MSFKHVSVLLQEVIDNLNIKPDGIYVDGTLGGGGHSLEIVKHLKEGGLLIGLDRDEHAIEAASKRLSEYKEHVFIHKSNFDKFSDVIKEHDIPGVDGIVLDLGVSSYQLDTESRGFSYSHDAPLDMRMDTSEEKSAYDLINESEESELAYIIRTYGEERYASRIASNIVKARQIKNIETTFELNDIISKSIPAASQKYGGHPSKRTFQAIRIALNRELDSISAVIPDMINALNDKGHLCIITFHSLEDRIVKNAFKLAQDPCTCPRDFPVCVCGKKSKGRIITKKPILPSEKEELENPRSKSAKLRVFERALK